MSESIEGALTDDAAADESAGAGPDDTDVTDDSVADTAPEDTAPDPDDTEPGDRAAADQETDTDPEPQPVVGPDAADHRPTVMLLGGGALSRELALAFQNLGGVVVAVDRYDAPAHGVADRTAVVDLNDADELSAVIAREKPQYVVAAESGVIAADALIAAAERGDSEVLPTPRSIRLSQNREGLRRLASDELGLPTVPFWFAGSVEELTAVAEHAGYPLVVKPVTGSLRDASPCCCGPTTSSPRGSARPRPGTSRTAACWPNRWSRWTSRSPC